MAAYIKKEFDKKFNPTWHCIVGRNFGNILLPVPPAKFHFRVFRLLRHPRDRTLHLLLLRSALSLSPSQGVAHDMCNHLGQMAILLFKSG